MTSVASQATEHLADPLIGRVVDRYRLERVLARGGMGVVYLARHEQLDKLAAVKTLLPPLQEGSARTRFVREAKALGMIKTPGVVDIYNVGQFSDGAPYILMEYLVGRTLAERLQASSHGCLSCEEALTLAAQLADTLAELHEKSIVHRDIKPDNIILVPDGGAGGERTKLLDLGIAKLLEDASATQTTMQPGTPLYMAPECCAGRPADGRADVYSLGCVLYELLCGRTPYLIDGGDVRNKHLFQRPTSPHKLVPTIPRAVSELVLELLARAPADRPSARDVAVRARHLLVSPAVGWRWRWLWRGLRLRRRGMKLAALLGMPILILLLLVFLAADLLARILPPWPMVSRILSASSMVRIPAGRFVMGSSKAEIEIAWDKAREYDRTLPAEQRGYEKDYLENNYLERETTERTVELNSFLMDRYEVTSEEFARFLNTRLRAQQIVVEKQCPAEKDPQSKVSGFWCVYTPDGSPFMNLHNDPSYGGITFQDGQFVVVPEFRRRPVVAVSWLAADSFCKAQSKRLPTEAEWEYVARRGGRRFPWGGQFPGCADAVLERASSPPFSRCRPEVAPVLPDVGSGAKDKTFDGIYDMGGSVTEWTADWFMEKLPLASPESRPPRQDPPTNAPHPLQRVLRGGAWTDSFLSARGAARFHAREDIMNAAIGFRCVRDLK